MIFIMFIALYNARYLITSIFSRWWECPHQILEPWTFWCGSVPHSEAITQTPTHMLSLN